MTRDAANLPHARHVFPPIRENAFIASERLDATLKLENMLLEEFRYVSQTAFQAMEDRTRMFNYYLTLVGALAAAFAAIYQFGSKVSITYSRPLAIALLLFIGLVGVAFSIKLVRLRQAWRESVICMNVIKEFYIQQFRQQMPQVEHAFRWRRETIPAGERVGSTTFVISATIALVEGVCFGGAVFISVTSTLSLIIGVAILLIVLVSNGFYYRHSLNVHDELEAIEEAEEIGL